MADSSKSLSSDFTIKAAPGSHADRVMGCLFGGPVGDAFGYTVEFSSLTDIRRRFGPEGIQEPVLDDDKLVVSDDTQMTLFTLEGLLRVASFMGLGLALLGISYLHQRIQQHQKTEL